MSTQGKNFGLSSSLKEEVMMSEKKGIVSILGSDSNERTKSDIAASLKRTLSADMSSKNWLSQHGFFPLKKIASSDGFQAFSSSIPDSSSSSEEDDYDGGHKDMIKKKEMEAEKQQQQQQPGQFDIWSSILSQKAQEDSKNLPPPYIHPLVKRSASSLSGKSLEICTESLGSETGSDGFSSYPPSETGDTEEDKEEEHQHQQQEEKAAEKFDIMEDWPVSKYKFAAGAAVSSKKTSPQSFPPPIPSLSSQGGASVHMRSRRDNGRLVLEAVSVASQNNFRAQRQDGRLVLTFINKTNEEEPAQEEQEGPENEEIEEEKKEFDQFELELDNSKDELELDGEEEQEVEAEEEETEENKEEEVENGREGAAAGGGGGGGDGDELRIVMEIAPKLSSGVTSFHRLALMMKKSMLLANRNPTWPKSLNKQVKFEEEEEEEEEEEVVVNPITPLTQSLPPRPPVARMIPSPPKATVAAATGKAAASLNAYEYYWKPKAITVPASVLDNVPIAQNPKNTNKLILTKNLVANEQQELLVLRGNKGDYLVPFFKGCKEPRRSLLFWEPHCIATS